MLTPTDLHMLRVQLYILYTEARRLECKKMSRKLMTHQRPK